MYQQVIILGAFHETIELCELCGTEIIGVIDNKAKGSFMGYPILGNDDDVLELATAYKEIPLVNAPDSSLVKKKLFLLYSDAGFDFATIISPRAFISKSASVGKGCIIQSGVNISSNVKIGRFCKLNYNANVMHDVSLGDFTIIGPNAVVLGRSQLGESVYIGANSTIEHDTVIVDGTKVQTASYIVNHNE